MWEYPNVRFEAMISIRFGFYMSRRYKRSIASLDGLFPISLLMST